MGTAARGAHGWDAIVVGTGFGGAVVGARLAERGLNVLMLERGPWWGPFGATRADGRHRPFPRGPLGIRKLLRGVHIARGSRSVELTLHRDGLYDLHLFERLACAVASGVGGGSLVYTNMQVQPEDDFFDAFPEEITAQEMQPHFAAVRQMLRPRPVPAPPVKARAFERALAASTGGEATYPDLAIEFDERRPGGTQAGGVPPVDAQRASAQGLRAEPLPGHAGTCIIGCEDGSKTTLDSTYVALAERSGAQVRALSLVQAIGRGAQGYEVRFEDLASGATLVAGAPRLVLAAGTLGTLRLLLAARDRHRTLPDLPAALGRGFTPNADMAAVVHEAAGAVHSDEGPSISAYLQERDRQGRHRSLVAEVGLPLAGLPLPAPARRRLSRSLVLFGMGRDRIAAEARLDGRGHLRIGASRLDDPEIFDDLQRRMRAIGDGYGARHVLTHAPYGHGSPSLVSVHPLGGAAIASGPQHGAVDHTGAVFGHPGLFVADGSLYPAPPGLPPSMTIAALAERIAPFVAASDPETHPRNQRSRP